MGSLFSKSKTPSANKVLPEPVDVRKVSSAPAKMNGTKGLDGTSPSPSTSIEARLSDPGASKSMEQAPSTPSKRGPKKIDVIGSQSDGAQLAAALKPASFVVPEEAKPWAAVFGDSIVKNFLSSDWKDREQSLTSIGRSVGNAKWMQGKEPSAVFATATEMLSKTLKDKVAPIFHASLDLVSTLLAAMSPLLSQSVLRSGMDPLMPTLVHRCGNLNSRIHEASLQALLGVASCSPFGYGYVGPFALTELAKKNRDASQSAQMYGRLDLLHSLLVTYRSTDDLSSEDILRFSKLGLDMPDDKVRQMAINVIVEVNRIQKAGGRGPLQLDRCLGVLKPALLLMLQKKCEEADAEDGGVMVVGSPKVKESGKLPSINMGFKVLGKALPPISPQQPSSPDTTLVPPLSPAGSVPSMKKKLSISRGLRPQESSSDLVSERGSSPATPPLAHARSKGSLLAPISSSQKLEDPLLDVPKYSKMFSIKGASSAKTEAAGGSMNSIPGALDETEEKLIQYLMDDAK